MKAEIEIGDYSRDKGVQLKWERGYSVKVKKENDEILIMANKEGLISLANHLLVLAQEGVEVGTHIHLDAYNSLEEDSIDLIIERRA